MRQQNINQSSMLKMGHVLRGIYRIDSYLSSGGFGNTYVATNIDFDEIDEKCAIKEFFMKGVNVRAANNTTVSVGVTENQPVFDEQLQKFKKEAKRMRQLKNPHIVKVHALFEENGTAYYVMDFIEGENLAQKLRRQNKPLPEDEVMRYLSQILDALQAVHDKGIWHLDLKPANILVDKNGNLSLIDFGASKQQSNKGGATASTAVSYTNGFAPREQMEQSQEKFGPWTDLYALGATLYNLLSNKLPPMPSDIDDDSSSDKHKVLPLPENVSEKTRTLILHLMGTNWKNRPQSVMEVQQLMKQFQQTPGDAHKIPLNDADYITLLKSDDNISELQAEKERIAKEKAEKERLAKEKAEKERIAKEKAEQERIAKEQAEQERLAKEQAEATRIAKEEEEKTILANNPGDKAEKTEQTKVIDDTPKPKWKMAIITGGTVAAIVIAAVLLLPKKNVVIDETDKEILWSKIATNNSNTISEIDTIDIISPTEQTERKQEEELSQKQKEEQQKKQKEEQEKKQKEELAKKQKEEQQKKQKEEQERKRKEEELNRQCLSYYNNANSAYNTRNLKGAWSNINSIENLSGSYARRSEVQKLKKKIQDTALEIKNITGKDPRFQ